MVSEPFEQESSNPFSGLLKTAFTLGPVGAAAFAGYQHVRSNASLNPIFAAAGSLRTGNLGQVGRGIGARLHKTDKATKVAQLAHADTVLDSLMKSDVANKLFSSIEQQNAVIQSLLDSLDDPGIGISSSGLLQSYKQDLLNISQGVTTVDDAKELLRSVVNAVTTSSSPETRIRFANNLDEYKRLGSQLASPSMMLNPTRHFNEIEPSSLSGVAKSRYENIIGKMGPSGSRQVSLVKYTGDNLGQIYARIFSPGREGKRRFLGLLPLDLKASESAGYTPVRMNENLSIGYRANKMAIDAEKAWNIVSKNRGKPMDISMFGSATMSYEDLFIQDFFKFGKVDPGKGFYVSNTNYVGARQRQFLAADTRLVSSGEPFGSTPGLASHIRRQAGLQHNFAQVVNMSGLRPEAQRELITTLSSVAGFGTGASPDRILGRGLGNEPYGTVGLYQGSALESLRGSPILRALRSGAGEGGQQQLQNWSRGLFPTTARVEQITGREALFFQRRARSMGVGRNISAGATAIRSGSDFAVSGGGLDWAKGVTGGTNKAIALDLTQFISGGEASRLGRGLAGTGAAYHIGREHVVSTFTKPLLEIGEHKVLGSKFMDFLVQNVEQGQLRRFSMKELEPFQDFLGIGPGGTQFLNKDPRRQAFHLGYTVTENAGKRHVNIVGGMERNMEMLKVFSLLHKGTMQQMSRREFRQLRGEAGLTAGLLNRLNIPERDLVLASGDMLRKGSGIIDVQLGTGFKLVTGEDLDIGNIDPGRLGAAENLLERSALTAAAKLGQKVKSGQVGAREAGMVLAGVFHSKDLSRGLDSAQVVDQQKIISTLSTYLEGEQLGGVLSAMRRGVALGATTMTQGEGHGDWKLGRGAVEPRFFSNLQHRLSRMGLSSSQSSDILAGIYKNKIGYKQHLTAAQGMLKLAESLAGQGGIYQAASDIADKIPRYTLDDIADLAVGDIGEFVRKHDAGFTLDIGAAQSTPARRALASGAQDVFRQTEVFFPGAETLGAMRGAQIKTTDGPVHIADKYTSLIQNFMKDIATLQQSTEKAKTSSVAILSDFKERAMEMAGDVIHQIGAGKIRGLSASMAGQYDLTGMTGMGNKGQLVFDIFKQTKGMSVFQDSKAFLTQLKDFMNGTLTEEEAARKAEMFYTSLEAGGRRQGIIGIASRHPLLSLGNVAPAQIFRAVHEVGKHGRDDEIFHRFVTTRTGKKVSRQLASRLTAQQRTDLGIGKRLTSFADVAKLPAKMRGEFFMAFVGGLKDFYKAEGGGTTFLPTLRENIHYLDARGNKKSLSVDLGISGGAIGDFDGDQYHMMMMNEESGSHIMSTLKSSQQRKAFLEAENVYKIKSELFAQEAKDSLQRLGIHGQVGFASTERIQQDVLKESAAKNLVGQLDTQLNRMRRSILDLQNVNPTAAAKAEEALALLKVTEEHAVIKGKKLEVYRPHAEMLTGAIKKAFDGDLSEFEEVMRSEIFRGSALLDEGIRMGVDEGSQAPQAFQDSVRAMGHEPILLQDALQTIRNAVQQSIAAPGGAEYSSARQLSMAMGGSGLQAKKAFNLLNQMRTLESGLMGEYGGDTAKQLSNAAGGVVGNVQNALARMDKRTMGLAAMGVAGTMALTGLISGQGYAREPLMMEGEVIPTQMQNAVAAGGVMQQRDRAPSPQEIMPQHDQYGMMGRTINPSTTYMRPPNSYQVRGQIPSERGINGANQFMSQLQGRGGYGSISINDHRRPITQNYIDRMLGDF